MIASQHFITQEKNVVSAVNPSHIICEYAWILGEWQLKPNLVLLFLGAENSLEEMALIFLIDLGSGIKVLESVSLGADPIVPVQKVRLLRTEQNQIFFSLGENLHFQCKYLEKPRWHLDGLPMYSLIQHEPHSFLPKKRQLKVSKELI